MRASHKFTAGWLEATDTHKAITDAAVQLARAGTLTDVRFNHVYAYDHGYASVPSRASRSPVRRGVDLCPTANLLSEVI
ncbi:hypothetical protein ACH4E7_27850 [Kitasatospora sp. NPDC018058]|uniref:hypothetical protein n=1 Tax=Kitasatospora sp. NPDC018058 TaxID=3364025 RepID=UPI0037BFA55A